MANETHGIEKVFYVLCVLVAMALTCWCLYEYHLDRDVTDIMLHKFHDTSDDLLPSITLCDKDPFQAYKAWFDRGDTNRIAKYADLIKGDKNVFKEILDPAIYNTTSVNEYIQTLNRIDYDDITVSLKDLISNFHISIPFNYEVEYSKYYEVIGNSLVINPDDSAIDPTLPPVASVNAYVSARHGRYKCFTFDVPMIQGREIREISMRVNTSQRTMGLDLGQYYFMLTFPNQTLQSRGSQIYLNRHHTNRPSCYKFEAHIGAMEVFRRRDKSRKRCNVDWKHQDEKQLNAIIKKIGCNPKHWKLQSPLPHCSSVDKYYDANQILYEKDGFEPPCRSIEKISKITKGTDFKWRCFSKSYLDLKFYLNEEAFYKEVVLVPAYTFQSLIGNAGNSLYKIITRCSVIQNYKTNFLT